MQILWFRRDLRIKDNQMLSVARGSVLPIFIFDNYILQNLDRNDKRVSFIYQALTSLKQQLQTIHLDLQVFFGNPLNIFTQLKQQGASNVICSCDFSPYAIKRDREIEKILPMQRLYDSFLFHPEQTINPNTQKPYVVFTPFYNNALKYIDNEIIEYTPNTTLKKHPYNYTIPSLESMGFNLQNNIFSSVYQVLKDFTAKINTYTVHRDMIDANATSHLSVHLRFGTISVRDIYRNTYYKQNSTAFIRQLFWREFYNSLLYFFPNSYTENMYYKNIVWENNLEYLQKWKTGNTGIFIIDSAILHLKNTGEMHNRLRMIVSSFLTRNLLIDWKYGEEFFAKYLLDYELASNVHSWQWSAGVGVDTKIFRIFNPIIQSKKFDPNALFIRSVLPQCKTISLKEIHSDIHCIVDLKSTRERAIQRIKNSTRNV